MLAVAEAARNVACAGAIPIGATNNLNFGNPQRPEIMWQFAEAVAGIGEACRAFEIPITGGNVSLYNETEGRAILPTPVLGVVGLIEDQSAVLGRVFPASDATIVLLGENRGELGGSEYLQTIHGLLRGVPPAIDLKQERALQTLLPALASEKLIQSAHDVSEGGFAVALAECCFDTGGRGADVDLPRPADARRAIWCRATIAALFGESVPQVIVSVDGRQGGDRGGAGESGRRAGAHHRQDGWHEHHHPGRRTGRAHVERVGSRTCMGDLDRRAARVTRACCGRVGRQRRSARRSGVARAKQTVLSQEDVVGVGRSAGGSKLYGQVQG